MYLFFLVIVFLFLDEFVSVIKKTELFVKLPFNLDSQFMKLYFGEKKNRIINYSEFAQLLHVLNLLINNFKFQ